ncbi:MAG: HAD hydrolase-like protein, partial [Candidatus Omnitrophica bacterium]|nr:HAD hydrolase-like protein [Candidatus Omnitrophota bacterium]
KVNYRSLVCAVCQAVVDSIEDDGKKILAAKMIPRDFTKQKIEDFDDTFLFGIKEHMPARLESNKTVLMELYLKNTSSARGPQAAKEEKPLKTFTTEPSELDLLIDGFGRAGGCLMFYTRGTDPDVYSLLQDIAGRLHEVTYGSDHGKFKKHMVVLKILEHLPARLAIEVLSELFADLFPKGHLEVNEIVKESKSGKIDFYISAVSLYMRFLNDLGESDELASVIDKLKIFVATGDADTVFVAVKILGEAVPFINDDPVKLDIFDKLADLFDLRKFAGSDKSSINGELYRSGLEKTCNAIALSINGTKAKKELFEKLINISKEKRSIRKIAVMLMGEMALSLDDDMLKKKAINEVFLGLLSARKSALRDIAIRSFIQITASIKENALKENILNDLFFALLPKDASVFTEKVKLLDRHIGRDPGLALMDYREKFHRLWERNPDLYLSIADALDRSATRERLFNELAEILPSKERLEIKLELRRLEKVSLIEDGLIVDLFLYGVSLVNLPYERIELLRSVVKVVDPVTWNTEKDLQWGGKYLTEKERAAKKMFDLIKKNVRNAARKEDKEDREIPKSEQVDSYGVQTIVEALEQHKGELEALYRKNHDERIKAPGAGGMDELKYISSALEEAANDGRLFALTLEQMFWLDEKMSGEELANLIMENLYYLSDTYTTFDKLVKKLENKENMVAVIKTFLVMRDQYKMVKMKAIIEEALAQKKQNQNEEIQEWGSDSAPENVPLKAAFFSWDGVVADNEVYNIEALMENLPGFFSGPKEAAMVYAGMNGLNREDKWEKLVFYAGEIGKKLPFKDANEFYDVFTKTAQQKMNEVNKEFRTVNGVTKTIMRLKETGVKVYILSDGRGDLLARKIEELGLSQIIDGMCSGPRSDYIKTVLAENNFSSDNAVMFANSEHAISDAKNCGVMVIGRGRDDASGAELTEAGAVFYITSFYDFKYDPVRFCIVEGDDSSLGKVFTDEKEGLLFHAGRGKKNGEGLQSMYVSLGAGREAVRSGNNAGLELLARKAAESLVAKSSIKMQEKTQESYFENMADEDAFDAENTTSLFMDVLAGKLKEDLTYRIQYDAKQLSVEQEAIVHAYVSVLRSVCGNSKIIENRIEDGSGAVFSVTCKGPAHNGKSEIFVRPSEGVSIEDCLLKIAGMINLAVASASITEEEMAKGERDEDYGPILGFIKRQREVITGEEFVFPEDPEGLRGALQKIVLDLPDFYVMSREEIKKYNLMAAVRIAA